MDIRKKKKGRTFFNSQLQRALQKYGVTHRLSTAYHPQSNGQTEVTNRAIKCILERSVRYNPKDWWYKHGSKTTTWRRGGGVAVKNQWCRRVQVVAVDVVVFVVSVDGRRTVLTVSPGRGRRCRGFCSSDRWTSSCVVGFNTAYPFTWIRRIVPPVQVGR
nr:retrovirus-related Pol polyprotein from transposon 17.6 [Tanacetum cinerariifolium]